MAFNGELKFGPAVFQLGGNLQVAPTLGYNVTFGLDLITGPFLREGASIEVGLPVSGRLTGKASIGNLVQVDAAADAIL